MENSEQPHLCVEVNFGEAVISSVSFGKGARAMALRSLGRNPPCSPRDEHWCFSVQSNFTAGVFSVDTALRGKNKQKVGGGDFRGILTP